MPVTLVWVLACSSGPSDEATDAHDPAVSDPSPPSEPGSGTENDRDGDGSPVGDDCNDEDPSVHPGADDPWYDGVDADCEGNSDFDQDDDGSDRIPEGTDCDDLDPFTFVGADEIWYDDLDEACDGGSDHDQDGDGDEAASGGGTDCDDEDATVDGLDRDLDGYSGCSGDCDDTRLEAFPGGVDLSCDGVDEDCLGGDYLCGLVYSADLATANWIEPDVVGIVLGLISDQYFGVQFSGADGLAGTTAALAAMGSGSGGFHPYCSTLVELPTGSLDPSGFVLGPFELSIEVLVALRLEDARLVGTVDPGALSLSDATLTGLVDTRPFDAFYGNFCALALGFGDVCEPCADGVVKCLPGEVGIEALDGGPMDLRTECP